MWQNYVVNFNITLNGNTSKIKSDRKYTTFFELDNKIAEIIKICAILGVKCGGQAAVESLHEVECARRRLCAFGGWRGGQRS